jgi:hypothetical protein
VKEVYATRNSVEAHLIRGLLEDAGIAAIVQDDAVSIGVAYVVHDPVPSVRILDDSQLERAEAIVAEWLREGPEVLPWKCRKCGEQIDGQFTSCWECGTERPV